ncbi:hypothetical protein CONLIGDRAFT_647742 [Coniochaeta ligniaria NRRL 30616]|uniref:C2H2-type domain-containing protein n=1 Tax=Coniochaeta ligniaria NRRL 30616 TaxID=1408157 RepID=A0A1J7IEY2_9PEZI|nr:hypothetical protein CONLIGDRAFT_647742 [Coniochaeta ligniaria NRRL 30616]
MSAQPREHPPTEGYSCPYRKRNPQKYNAANKPFVGCTGASIHTFEDVKDHVGKHHGQSLYDCLSCAERFKTHREAKEHQERDYCIFDTKRTGVTIEGVVPHIATGPRTWTSLWAKLFGEHDRPKSPADRVFAEFRDPYQQGCKTS